MDAPAQVPALVHVLRLLLPLFAEMPLSLQVINTRPFTPESRDDTLYSGLLQLPAGTTVLVSDITMEEGKVNDAGKTPLCVLVSLFIFEGSLTSLYIGVRHKKSPGLRQCHFPANPRLSISLCFAISVSYGSLIHCIDWRKSQSLCRGDCILLSPKPTVPLTSITLMSSYLDTN